MEKPWVSILRRVYRVARGIPGVEPVAKRLGRRLGLVPVPRKAPDHVDPRSASAYSGKRPYPYPGPEHYRAVEDAYRASRRGGAATDMAFVSAIMGNYERPQRHEHLIASAEYIVVTDGIAPGSETGRLVLAERMDPNPIRAARFVKTHPYLYAPGIPLIIWLDSNIIIRRDLSPLIGAFMQSGRPVGVFAHPFRSSIYDEAEVCIREKRDDPQVIAAQMQRYRDAGYDSDNLIESNLLMLRMDVPETRRFLDRWWAEIERGSRRDQLSMNYAADMEGVAFFPLTSRGDSIRNLPHFAILNHQANAPDKTGPPGPEGHAASS